MPRDGDIDYARFTRAQLEDALARIDRREYPLNFANLTTELARRPVEPPVVPSRDDTLTGAGLALPAWFQHAAESRAVRVVTRAGLAVVGVLGIIGMWLSDLVPSELLGRLQVRAAVVVGVLGFVAAVSRRGPLFDIRRQPILDRFQTRAWIRNDLVRASFAALLGMACGVGAAHGAGWLYTVAHGVPAERTFTAWRCDRPVLENVFIGPRRGLCFSTRYPKGSRIRVTGDQSRFGIRTETVKIVREET